jgi:hypothetical protein
MYADWKYLSSVETKYSREMRVLVEKLMFTLVTPIERDLESKNNFSIYEKH